MRLILASKSPRRRVLLKAAGLSYSVESPRGISEEARSGESPRKLVRRLAAEKALSVAVRRKGAWVVGCDTEVVLHRKRMGKPGNPTEAVRMIRSLEGRTHQVLSGIAWVDPQGRLRGTECVESLVTFGRISKVDLERTLALREPYDKAGGYGIQGTASKWVVRLKGDYFNVMGLPVTRLWLGLIRFGAFRSSGPSR